MQCKLCNKEMMIVGADFPIWYRGANYQTDAMRCSGEKCDSGYAIVIEGPLTGRKFIIYNKKIKEIK